MNPSHYQKATLVTLSPSYHTNKVDAGQLLDTLGELRDVIAKLDGIKKALFYGKEMAPAVLAQLGDPDTEQYGHIQVNLLHNDPDVGVGLLHAIIGLATEAGEQCELLEDVLRGQKQFDAVNYLEESGDATWYISNGLNMLGFTFEQCFRTNIDKLQGTPDKPGRFRGKFDEFYANNRDLVRERETLEEGAKMDMSQAFAEVESEALARTMAMEEGKEFAKLTNWVVVGGRLFGDLTEHSRIGPGKNARTSTISPGTPVSEFKPGGVVRTENTIYVLGIPG